MKELELNNRLIIMYYNSIIEKKWSPSTIKNKLAYFKRKAEYEDHLSLQCANSKFKLEKFIEKLNSGVQVSESE